MELQNYFITFNDPRIGWTSLVVQDKPLKQKGIKVKDRDKGLLMTASGLFWIQAGSFLMKNPKRGNYFVSFRINKKVVSGKDARKFYLSHPITKGPKHTGQSYRLFMPSVLASGEARFASNLEWRLRTKIEQSLKKK